MTTTRQFNVQGDGLWFRLVDPKKSGNNLTLVFESREVAILRTYNKPLTASWGQQTRVAFVKRMIREVKEFPLVLKTPVLKKPPKNQKQVKSKAKKKEDRDLGLRQDYRYDSKISGVRPTITIKGAPASPNQIKNCDVVLDVGAGMALRRKFLVMAIMAGIVESQCNNLPFGDETSIGFFQQQPQYYPGVGMDLVKQATAFYGKLKAVEAANPSKPYWELVADVQRPREDLRKEYDRWRHEAERIVDAYGVVGGDDSTDADVALQNLMSWEAKEAINYQFTRGQPMQDKGGGVKWKRENSWDCMGRLADEVNWRRFEVSGKVYFIDEPSLFKSQPQMYISEETDGVQWIDWDLDIGKEGAIVTVEAFLGKWAAPPGSTVVIFDEGPINGRWLVTEIDRNIFGSDGTITLKKPRGKLPEPTRQDLQSQWTTGILTGGRGEGKPNKALGDYVDPLTTPMPKSSQFRVSDPEGAPSAVGGRFHAAVDWMAPANSEVRSPQDGEVVEITASKGSTGQVYGGVVKVQTQRGYVWVFRHVNPSASIRVGKQVDAGDRLAGVTAWFTNPFSSHAHIELWKTLGGGYRLENMLDPIEYIKQVKAGKPV